MIKEIPRNIYERVLKDERSMREDQLGRVTKDVLLSLLFFCIAQIVVYLRVSCRFISSLVGFYPFIFLN